MNWRLYSFVLRGKLRKSIMLSLKVRPKVSSEIASELKTSLPNISKAVSELKKKGLVECLTPELKVGRVYTLTKIGKEIINKIH
ncbi:MAG: ArsR family transcriptional regulator [Candidatus Aenigmatarchaeota archaeon]